MQGRAPRQELLFFLLSVSLTDSGKAVGVRAANHCGVGSSITDLVRSKALEPAFSRLRWDDTIG